MSTTLRYNEYYNMQETFDWLYERSKNKATKGLRLLEIIMSKENILLAYRTIKTNVGSKTKGTDGLTIANYKIKDEDTFVEEIRSTLKDYKPNSIRRIEIPKDDGKTRPLGIPTMKDRLIQQMFKQVLEPICEARFFKHSYGFRPNRSAHNAMARCQHIINFNQLHHVVDIDIKGFFDNVNHTRLLKQMYEIGIKDRRVLKIVGKMLKAPIKGIGIPTKGTPQGGILSPLLSNIVLNELDWWVSDQWETFETKFPYKVSTSKFKCLKTTNMKEMFIVRYADDFKIFTRNHEMASKIFHAIKSYLKNNLKLDISKDKSQIVNIRKKRSDFLGFSLKAVRKKKKHIANTFVAQKKKEKIKSRIKQLVTAIERNTHAVTVHKYNMYIMGVKNYYRYATHVTKDFNRIAYQLSKTLYNRLRLKGRHEIPIEPTETYKRFNKGRYKTFKVCGVYLHPLADVKTTNVLNFTQEICNYTKEGRDIKFKRLKPNIRIEIYKLTKISYDNNTVELGDNKLSKYSAQKGKCSVTGKFLFAEELAVHHKIPKKLGGTDEFSNLVCLHKDIHKLIHATTKETIEQYTIKLQLDEKQLKELNKYRKECNLFDLV